MSEKNHIVFFELYGKKMMTTILAYNQEDAKQRIKDRIIFHKVGLSYNNDAFNEATDAIDMINHILGGKKK